MKLIAKKDFTLDGKRFCKDKEVNVKDYMTIVRLNEKGFINPIGREELLKIKEELKNPKKIKQENEEE